MRLRGRAAATGYSYGWPAGGNVQPNVSLQYLFDEASGNLTDEVASLVATKTGTPTYSQTETGDYEGISPGILNPSTSFFSNTTNPVTPAFIDTNDFVVEYWFKNSTDASVTRHVWGTDDGVTGGIYMRTGTNGANGEVTTVLTATDATTLTKTWTITSKPLHDGNIHKVRVSANRAGNQECFVDGVSYGTGSMSTLAGKSIPAPQLLIFKSHLGYNYKGTLYELRLTIGNYSNNSGGPSGG